MAAQASLAKISKIEFFACLPSGTYFFICLYLFFNIDTDKNGSSQALWSLVLELVASTSRNPTSVLGILFTAYLLGSILRAIPVSYAERMMQWKKSEFPYKENISALIDNATKYCEASGIKKDDLPLHDRDTTAIIFNYWKDVLCVNSPNAFDNYREFEARTRFFAGMFLSGFAGIITSVAAFVKYGLHSPAVLYLFITSLIIAIVFGKGIKTVRKQEVSTLVGLYIAYIQSGRTSLKS
jgi:hypothetical protein